jgi:hypothetical protein
MRTQKTHMAKQTWRKQVAIAMAQQKWRQLPQTLYRFNADKTQSAGSI